MRADPDCIIRGWPAVTGFETIVGHEPIAGDAFATRFPLDTPWYRLARHGKLRIRNLLARRERQWL